MIIEAGIADAYGAGFEFEKETIIKAQNNLTEYKVHPRYKSIYKTYTDDTQMAIAISEYILEEKKWSKLEIANKFVEVFKRDPRKGYSSRFYDILSTIKNGEELLKTLTLASNRNGAAMRSYPIGVYKNELEILEKSKLQASITHNTKEGILSSQVIALTAHYFLYNKGPKSELTQYLRNVLNFPFDFKKASTVKMEAIPTVNTVISLVLEHNSLAQCLKEAVYLGGDTDTVASLAVSLLSINYDSQKDLPNWMYDKLEDDTFGKSYLIELDKKLISLML
ncbi:ADP-ribosylglycohydrolase family protein [uncultured Aquimarina sp.]|uniref:ADP-ribosylglycohydrolase family protein n=1 Tax=uncultured Aquimarina sp. TaxID=575652 RepID=UPI00260A6F4C|nr:ADP-ribosylglycohydrolase family protein [uncultured Aquimarina sp.]